jgi:phosphohistidine swiveling domain-containing protein
MHSPITDPTIGSSEPGRYWTSTNLGEATPDVMSPMCWSVWADAAEISWLQAMQDFGVLSPKQVFASPDPNDRGLSYFYGQGAFNVDAVCALVARLPGVSGRDFERDLMGSVRDDAPDYQSAPWRIPVIAVKAPWALLRMSGRIQHKHDELFTWWQHEVFDGNHGDTTALQRLIASRQRFQDIFSPHTAIRFMFQGGQSAIASAANKAGDPALATKLISGVGDVMETQMSDDLWSLAHGELNEMTFLRTWGYHGPNEGNPYTTIWREDPAPVRSLARSVARRTGGERPRDRAERSRAASVEAHRQLLAASPAAQRPALKWLLNRMRNIVRTLHVGKSGYLMALDGCRAAARDFGSEQVAHGRLREVDDTFFLTIEECGQLERGELPDAERIVVIRRQNREFHKQITLPVTFTGMPEPLPIVSTDGKESESPRQISGIASGGGRVEGRARVITDPSADADLDEGDILVCRFTDPSWAAIMTLAEALVIDIGSSASHGAVVARELGIPYVIGTKNGTSVINDGDRLVVDGENNAVDIQPADRPITADSVLD